LNEQAVEMTNVRTEPLSVVERRKAARFNFGK
jgi:hypothetical protein